MFPSPAAGPCPAVRTPRPNLLGTGVLGTWKSVEDADGEQIRKPRYSFTLTLHRCAGAVAPRSVEGRGAEPALRPIINQISVWLAVR